MSERPVIIVADDEPAVRESLDRALSREGFQVILSEDGQTALEHLRGGGADLLLADLRMPGLSGLELLRAAKLLAPEVEVVLITGHGTIEEAVEAMKEGAYDFITKPFQRATLLKAIRKAMERQALVRENRALHRRLDDLLQSGKIVGTSPAIRRLLELVEQVAPTSATILIQGESGTGKELVANALHELSPRKGRPLIKLNCAALPDTLLESELFGFERGAFTGAESRKEGRFELADGGSLFLDEVGDLSPVTQGKLLRVLQEGEFERLGGTKTIRVDVRVIAATNQDLGAAVREKRFREDLYYRLNVIALTLPPLRERAEDIPLLAQHFLRIYTAKNNKTLEGFSREAMECLLGYAWPGNIRELENAVERAVILSRGRFLEPGDFPEALRQGARVEHAISIPIGTSLDEVEQRLIEETLRYTRGDKNLAAKLLGIASRTIYRKLKGFSGPDASEGPRTD